MGGYFACLYRYTIEEEQRVQASEANDYLWTISGNILLITDKGWESEDSRLFDTYINRDFYVAEIDMITADGILEDFVLDPYSSQIIFSTIYKIFSQFLITLPMKPTFLKISKSYKSWFFIPIHLILRKLLDGKFLWEDI